MEIGGKDTILQLPELVGAIRSVVLSSVRAHWPRSVAQLCGDDEMAESFYYKCEDASTSWRDHGRIVANADSMIHVIIEDGQMTVVTDGPETEKILVEIEDALELMKVLVGS